MIDGAPGTTRLILQGVRVPFPHGGIVHFYPGAYAVGAFLIDSTLLFVAVVEPATLPGADPRDQLARPNEFEIEYDIRVVCAGDEVPALIPTIPLFAQDRLYAILFAEA